MSFTFHRKLPFPKEIKERYPLSEKGKIQKAMRDSQIRDALRGVSGKLLIVIGPCSADHDDSVLDYTCRLAALESKISDQIVLVPRVYTSKPRTTGDGYKGMLHQPDPQAAPDLLSGILAVRSLHTRIIEETGLAPADELLYPENYWYLADVLSYVAVGARSVENQQHRLVASAIEVPVGMKNPLSGDLDSMRNAVHAATVPHTFLYRGWEVTSTGNPYAHCILRGSTSGPNYMMDPGLPYLVDTNHGNSGKDYTLQPEISREVLKAPRANLRGFMIESYLESGSQAISESIYGKSITDPCLGWAETESLLLEIADLWKNER